MPQSRRAQVIINYNGKDISRDIAPFLLTFSFTDNAEGKADDLAITFEDRGGLWLNDWTPAKSDIITASIAFHDSQSTSLPCGSFSVDQIEYSYPPAVFSVKAVSSSVKKKASTERKNRFWENVTLASIAGQIAAENSLALFMPSPPPNVLRRVDQSEQSDLDFLRALCEDFGQAVKIQESRLIVYDKEEYEERGAVSVIDIASDRVLSCKFTNKSAQTFKKARVRYHDPVKDETYDAEYEDYDEDGSERDLEIYERAESQGHAETIAKERVINANRREITGSISLMGDTRLCAAVTVEITGAGNFSGKDFVNKCTHSVSRSGYVTSLELGLPKSEKAKTKSRIVHRQSSAPAPDLYYDGEFHY